jgi:hypothetical protein
MINKINQIKKLVEEKRKIDKEIDFIKKELTKHLMLYGKSKESDDCLVYEQEMPNGEKYQCEIYLDIGKYDKDKRIACEWDVLN